MQGLRVFPKKGLEISLEILINPELPLKVIRAQEWSYNSYKLETFFFLWSLKKHFCVP